MATIMMGNLLATGGSLLAAQVQFDPMGGWVTLLVLAALFVAAQAWLYRRPGQRLSPSARRWLWLLRGAAIVTVLFVALRPTWVSSSSRIERPTLVVMTDVSRSMAIRDERVGRDDKATGRDERPAAGGADGQFVTRAEAATAGLRANRELLRNLARKYDLLVYTFADNLSAATGAAGLGGAMGANRADTASPSSAGGLKRTATDAGGSANSAGSANPAGEAQVEALLAARTPGGASTRLGDCLKAVMESNANRRLAGVVVLSDGVSNLSQLAPTDAARLLGRHGAALYTAAYGSAEPTGAVRDAVARDINVRPTLFIGNQTEVAGDFLFHGLAGEKVEVQLLADGKPVGRETVAVTSNRQPAKVKLMYLAEAAGIHKLELRSVPAAGEMVEANNTISTFVDAVEGGLRVLLVSGSLSSEGKFISLAVRQAGEFQLERRLLITREEARQLVPARAEEWAEYNVVIFDDVPAAYLSSEQMESLAQAVAARSTGFLMIGGERAFGAGGYAGTAIAKLLPVAISSKDKQIDKPLKFRPTAAGLQLKVLQLEKDPAATDQAWLGLPPLLGASVLGQAKETAEVLATTESGEPLLVVGQYQAGRVAALAADTTYQWYLSPQSAADTPGKYHRRFWRQLLLYLTGRDVETRGNVWVVASQQRYGLSELQSKRQTITVTAGVTDGRGSPVTDATCTMTLRGPGRDDVAVSLWRRGDNYEGTIQAEQVGDYEVRLTAFRGGAQVGQAQARFTVYQPDVELEEPEAAPAVLAELSRLSGGQAYAGRDLDQLLKSLLTRDVSNLVRFEVRRGLWDNFYLLAIFVALLTAEWLLRRRVGLV